MLGILAQTTLSEEIREDAVGVGVEGRTVCFHAVLSWGMGNGAPELRINLFIHLLLHSLILPPLSLILDSTFLLKIFRTLFPNLHYFFPSGVSSPYFNLFIPPYHPQAFAYMKTQFPTHETYFKLLNLKWLE